MLVPPGKWAAMMRRFYQCSMFNAQFSNHFSPLASLLCLFVLFSLFACSPLGLVTPMPDDPVAHYRAALQPWARSDLETVGPLPRYHITAQLNPDSTILQGVAQVTLPASGPEVVFRLYPTLTNYGGAMRVTSARLNDTPLAIESLADGTAIRLVLPEPRPNPLIINLNFETDLPGQPGAGHANYTLFGWDGPVLSLPGFYPTRAVKQGDQWVLDQPPAHADVLFNEVALYQVDLTLPKNLAVAAGGVTLNVIDNPNDTRTWQIAGGPLRDVTIIAGPFQTVSENAAGAVVTS